MASCEINIGGKKVDNQLVSKGVDIANKSGDFNMALIKSYDVVNDHVSLREWETYLKGVWETSPKSRRIKDGDFYEGTPTDDVKAVKDILNLENQTFETSRGKIESAITEESKVALDTFRNHLIERSAPLSNVEVKRVLKSLKQLLEVGKRESKMDQMRTAARRAIRTKLGAKLQQEGKFSGLDRLLGVTFPYIKKFKGNTSEYTHAEMMEDYREMLELLSARKKITEITDADLKKINNTVSKMTNALGAVPPQINKIDEGDKEAAKEQFKNMQEFIDPKTLKLRDERELAREMKELTDEDLEGLTAAEIMDLVDSVSAMQESILPFPAVVALVKIKEYQAEKATEEVLENVEENDLVNLWSRGYGKIAQLFGGNKKESFNYIFRSRSSAYAGTVIGDKKNVLFRQVARKLAVADERATQEKEGLYNREDIVSRALGEGSGRYKKIYTTAILSFVEQHELNDDQWSAEQLVDQYIDRGRNADLVSVEAIDLMKKLKEKYMKDGKFDKAALMNAVESDAGMRALRNYNLENGISVVEKLIHNNATMRGEAKPIIENRSPIKVLWTAKDGSVDPVIEFADSLNPDPAVRKKTTETSPSEGGPVPVVDFDLLTSSTSFAAEVVTDYHVSPLLDLAWNSSEKALDNLIKKGAKPIAIAAARGWKQFMHSEIKGYIASHAENYSWLAEAGKLALKASYAAKLVRKDKIFSETIGNFSWWAIEDPGAAIRGLGSDAVHRADLGLILQNIGTFQNSKLTTGGSWSGKNIDSTWLKNGSRERNVPGQFDNVVGAAKRAGKVLSIPGKVGDKVSSWALSGPDLLFTRPGTLGVFERHFEEVSGVKLTKVEYDLIAANDETFMAKHATQLSEAMAIAEEKSVRAASTNNSIAAVARFKKDANDPLMTKFYKLGSGYLMSFSINEAAAAKFYFRGMMGREEISRTQGVQGYAAVLVRMASYRPMMTAFAILLGYLGLSDDDEDEEKTWRDVYTEFRRDLLGSFFIVTTQGSHGSWLREPTNQLIELMNKHYFGALRDDEPYSEWDHAMTFMMLREKDFTGRKDFVQIAARFTGPAGSVVKDADHLWKLYTTANNKNSDDLWEDFYEELLLFTAAYSNALPFYRDIVNDRKADRYKAKKRKKASKSKRGSRSTSRGKRKKDKRG